ncbi:orf5 [Cryptophlebia peltastica nucleopolyhedrovirus]|uniref:Orf5 n=1 Tax=Cryptophlebia peltastica nucleopolyhedrovirus TaxID=2304025 RepID=A0A346RNM4_9ABAC|nr:orf5 [Cryptophlebia peltastica nucleopolyhedrovirus]AXS67671.1 orf5 [Cryptophlebia peltastica nucleopolyhedrovirus]
MFNNLIRQYKISEKETGDAKKLRQIDAFNFCRYIQNYYEFNTDQSSFYLYNIRTAVIKYDLILRMEKFKKFVKRRYFKEHGVRMHQDKVMCPDKHYVDIYKPKLTKIHLTSKEEKYSDDSDLDSSEDEGFGGLRQRPRSPIRFRIVNNTRVMSRYYPQY